MKKFISILITLLVIGDIITTKLVLKSDLVIEGNLIARFMIDNSIFIIIKVLSLLIMLICINHIDKLNKLEVLVLIILIIILFIAVINNVIKIITIEGLIPS